MRPDHPHPDPLPRCRRGKYIASALLNDRVVHNVLIEIDPAGIIAGVTHDSTEQAERLPGLVVPGMANLHSHAFQRAMAGLAERAGPVGDNFWRWREVMYRFLAVLTPDDIEAIAAQLYVECLLHGYTAVGEFHYLHNTPDGMPYADPTELARRIVHAAADSGIGLTLLPVLYRHAQFGGAPPLPAQGRFVLTLDAHARLCETMATLVPVGIAPHSLRAVTSEELSAAVALADSLGPDTPLHIHVAEQEKEVADCVAWSGARPVQWLLDQAPVGPRWCLVHVTHTTPEERRSLAARGAVVGLCPTTEANLGDGIFPLPDWLAAEGRFGIGSDSNVSTSPVEELRWLEYTHRLQTRRRNVTGDNAGDSVGLGLYRRALAGGAQALGRHAGTIATGYVADLVVLDTDHPALLGRSGDALLDAWLFSGNNTPVRDVMVAGAWVVRDGHHVRQQAILADYAKTMRRLAAAL